MIWSEEALLLFRPIRTYRAMAESGRRSALEGIVVTLLVVGAFVSVTTSGRLVPFHVLSPLLFWSFVPLWQAVAMIATSRTFAPKASLRTTLGLHFAGNGPYVVFLLSVAAWCIFAPDPGRLIGAMFPVLACAVIGTLVWSAFVTFGLFRGGLGLTRLRSLAATALYYVLLLGSFLAYYTTMGQLLPLLGQR